VPLVAVAQPTADSALLYEVTGPGIKKPSYVFGTIHIVCEKDLTFGAKLRDYISRTDQVFLEIDLDDPAQLQKLQQGILSLKTPKAQLSEKEAASVDRIYKEYLGIPFSAVENLPPTIATTLLLTSPKVIGCSNANGVDKIIAGLASETRKTVLGLETPEFQLEMIKTYDSKEGVEMLRKWSTQAEKMISDFQTIYKQYLAQDFKALTENMGQTGFSPEDSRELLEKRNRNWIPIIEREVRLKPTFIAFGAGHLGGETGVIELLRAKGFKVTPIRL
jgi:uncharacterized protein YbaP (TraB family)